MIRTSSYAVPAAGEALIPHVFERREPGPSEILMKIHYCGICHSDLHIGHGELGDRGWPLVPGHEIVGVVERVGSEVVSHRPGDRVGVGCLVDSCGTCNHCEHGDEHFCRSSVGTYAGVDRHGEPTKGGYSTWLTLESRFALKIPDALPLDVAAPLLCAGITTYSPLKHFGAGPGRKVGVVGLGGLGHMAVKYAVAMGCEVTVISSSERKKADAAAMGAADFLVVSDKDAMKAAGESLDLIVNTVSAPSDVNKLMGLLKVDGNMVMLGLSGEAPVKVMPLMSRRRSLSGSMIGGLPETQEMLDFSAKHAIAPDIEVLPMERVNDAWARLEKGDVRYRFVLDLRDFEIA